MNELNRREAQLQYELQADATAQAEKLVELLRGAADGDINMPRANALIKQMCGAVVERLRVHAETVTRGLGGRYKTWLRALPLEVAALIAIRECVRLCTRPTDRVVTVQQLTYAVGQLWELEVRIAQASEVNEPYMQKIHDQVKERGTTDTRHIRNLYNVAVNRVMKGSIDLSLSRTEIVNIGKFGVDACYEAGLLELHRGTGPGGSIVHYTLPEEVLNYLVQYTDDDVCRVINREETRMLCPPDPWTNLVDGGYLSTRRRVASPMMSMRKLRKSIRREVMHEFTAEKMPLVFRAVNYLQSIPYSLHKPTAVAISRVWQGGGGLMGVPRATGPVKPKFPLPDTWNKASATDEELRAFEGWKIDAAEFYDSLKEWRGKVRECGAFLRSVKEADGPYWFPMYVDTRQRLYYRGLPNPQGSDLAKAVLHFHEKKPLGKDGLFWLKVHIANSMGFDKDRMSDRAKWVDTRWEAIARALDVPEDNPDVWGTDNPWCAYSASWELREAYRSGDPESYCTGIPVHMDATCSGLQHFSALLRDPIGGQYVNLSDEAQTGPKQDIYSRVATMAMKRIQDDLDANPEHPYAGYLLKLFDDGVPRNLTKKPVMTFVYGATLTGTARHCERYITKDMQHVFDDTVSQYKLCQYLARCLFDGVEAAVPAAVEAMKWLQKVARSMPAGKRMQWRTRSGFLVQHDYQSYEDFTVTLRSCGVRETIVRDWTDGTRPHAMANAISPNFTHGNDSTHKVLTANRMEDAGLAMVGIHDSFGTHPCDVPAMHKHLREAFVELYSGPNQLAEFLWDVNGTAPYIPTRGTLDLSCVLESEFFFS